jgi:hypothetical protein
MYKKVPAKRRDFFIKPKKQTNISPAKGKALTRE